MDVIRQAPLICTGHTRPVVNVQFNSDVDSGCYLVSASKDGKAMLRDGLKGDWIGTFHGHKGCIWVTKLDSKALKAATGSADFSAKIWNVESGDEVYSLKHNHMVRDLDFSKTNGENFLATVDNKLQLNYYDLMKPEESIFTSVVHSDFIRKVLFVQDDRRILTVSTDNSIKIWDLSSPTSKPCQEFNYALSQTPMDFTIGRGQGNVVQYIVTAGKSVEILSFDLRHPNSGGDDAYPLLDKKILPFSAPVYAIDIHPLEDVILAGLEDSTVERCSLDSDVSFESCKGHFGPVHSVKFVPGNGRHFASASEDGTIRLWQSKPGETFGLWSYSEDTEDVNRNF